MGIVSSEVGIRRGTRRESGPGPVPGEGLCPSGNYANSRPSARQVRFRTMISRARTLRDLHGPIDAGGIGGAQRSTAAAAGIIVLDKPTGPTRASWWTGWSTCCRG